MHHSVIISLQLTHDQRTNNLPILTGAPFSTRGWKKLDLISNNNNNKTYICILTTVNMCWPLILYYGDCQCFSVNLSICHLIIPHPLSLSRLHHADNINEIIIENVKRLVTRLTGHMTKLVLHIYFIGSRFFVAMPLYVTFGWSS